MLKIFLGIVVSGVVLFSSAYIILLSDQVHAVSANIIITHIQAGGVGAATQEFIVVYNNSSDEVDITNWCLMNKSGAKFSCFAPPVAGQAVYLPSYRYAVVVSNTFATTLPSGAAVTLYTPTNVSSGSITASSDAVSLLDHTGQIVDSYAWNLALSAGMHAERRLSEDPRLYVDTDANADWHIAQSQSLPIDGTVIDTTVADMCPNIEGMQTSLTNQQELNNEGECVDTLIAIILITELFPNAIGADTGNEFIELYNPNAWPIQLSEYELYVGPDSNIRYDFPVGSSIEPLGYKSFSNTDIAFNLLNSSSRALIMSKTGLVVSQVPSYVDPIEGQSWAMIDDEWHYTNSPTPGAANLAMDLSLLEPTSLGQQPCAANQYRSPETNRCRLLSLMVSTVSPCKDGQYRSEETNRCRNIATDAKTITSCGEDEERSAETNRCRKIVVASRPAPCKEGQERNPDTNRCRTVTKMPNAEYGVLGVKTDSGGSGYVLIAIGGVLLLALGYAVWEWRDEIGKFFQKYQRKIIRFARIRK